MILKDDLKEKKSYIGKEVSLKRIKKGEAKLVYIASNCPDKDEIINNCNVNDIKFVELKENSKEVGVICKKPFNVSVVSF